MPQRGRLPGASGPDQIVCHADIDCFYASCERLRESALRGEPVVVGMGYEPGTTNGAVATASYEAREFGVESAQAISKALDALPRKIDAAKADDQSVEKAGFYRPVDMEYYESVASDIKAILHERADTVREVSIDEAYLDLTERVEWGGELRSFAAELKAEIREEVGVTASLGIAPTMSAAKVASDHDKPDGLVVVEPGDVQSFFSDLDVEEVHGVGPVTAAEMREMGIETAGDLATADPARLEAAFGERGRRVHRFARGEDGREVEPKGRPKSFSRESAFTEATTDEERQRERLQTLAEAVAGRADQRGVLYQTIGIKVVTPPFDVHTRANSLSGPVADEELVVDVATELFEEFDGEEIRKLGVRVSNLSFGSESQPSLAAFLGETDADSEDESVDAGAVSKGQPIGSDVEPPEGQSSLRDFD
ncbi:MAG: DNA polymerase IV [Halovenus sp.]